MPRIARVVIPGYPYHITQRGNYKQNIFSDDGDKVKYLTLVKEYTERYKVEVLSYCLMVNHIHFIMVPPESDTFGLIFNQISRRYAKYFNYKFDRTGHLWQDRYYSCPLDKDHLFEAMRYIENNPVKAGYVRSPEEYSWSSAQGHIDPSIKDEILADYTPYLEKIENWKEYLNEKQNEHIISNIRLCTKNGRPSGNEDFIQKLEYKTGRILRKIPKGRPKINK